MPTVSEAIHAEINLLNDRVNLRILDNEKDNAAIKMLESLIEKIGDEGTMYVKTKIDGPPPREACAKKIDAILVSAGKSLGYAQITRNLEAGGASYTGRTVKAALVVLVDTQRAIMNEDGTWSAAQ